MAMLPHTHTLIGACVTSSQARIAEVEFAGLISVEQLSHICRTIADGGVVHSIVGLDQLTRTHAHDQCPESLVRRKR